MALIAMGSIAVRRARKGEKGDPGTNGTSYARNLLLNSADFDAAPPSEWEKWGSVPYLAVKTENGENVMTMRTSAVAYQGIKQTRTDKAYLHGGDTIAVSFDAAVFDTGTYTLEWMVHFRPVGGGDTITQVSGTVTISSSTMRRFTAVATVPENITGGCGFCFMIGSSSAATAVSAKVDRLKLEVNTAASDWSPAPEDSQLYRIVTDPASPWIWQQGGEVTQSDTDGTPTDKTNWNDPDGNQYTMTAKVVKGQSDTAEDGWTFAFTTTNVEATFKDSTVTFTQPSKDEDKVNWQTEGSVKITATKGTRTLTAEFKMSINALGTWKFEVINDTAKATSHLIEASIDENGLMKKADYETTIKQSAKQLELVAKSMDISDGGTGKLLAESGAVLTADKAGLYTKDANGNNATIGTYVNGIVKLTGKEVQIASDALDVSGDLDLHGLLTEGSTYCDYWGYMYKDGEQVFAPASSGDLPWRYISMSGYMKSMVFKNWTYAAEGNPHDSSAIVSNESRLRVAVLPLYDTLPYELNGSTYSFGGYKQNGTHLVIRNMFNPKIANWSMSGVNKAASLAGAVIVCSDPRLLTPDFTPSSSSDDLSWWMDPLSNGAKWWGGCMVCQGLRGRFLIVMPGEAVELVTSVERYGTDSFLTWYVVSNGYEPITQRIGIGNPSIDSTTGTDIAIGKFGELSNRTTMLDMSGGYYKESFFGPAAAACTTTNQTQFTIKVNDQGTMTVSVGAVQD